jgi:hypothetical protein
LRDRSLGVLIFALAIMAMIGYFWWLFLAPEDIVFLGKTASEWAIIIPVVIIVYAVLFVVAWIGWALASTAPPLPLTRKPENEKENNDD